MGNSISQTSQLLHSSLIRTADDSLKIMRKNSCQTSFQPSCQTSCQILMLYVIKCYNYLAKNCIHLRFINTCVLNRSGTQFQSEFYNLFAITVTCDGYNCCCMIAFVNAPLATFANCAYFLPMVEMCRENFSLLEPKSRHHNYTRKL